MKYLLWFSFLVLLTTCTQQKNGGEVEVDVSTLPKLERIRLVDLDGKAINLEDYRGKRVFLNLWATWCKPCIAEMPDLSSANDVLSKEGYVFLAASDESLDKIKKFASKYDFSFQFVKMENSVYDLEVPALPTSFVIDAKGDLVYEEVGAKDWDSEKELAKLRDF